MNAKEAKEELLQYYYDREYIKQLELEAQTYLNRAACFANTNEAYADSVKRAGERLIEEARGIERKNTTIISTIAMVSQPYKTILHLRYIERRGIAVIADNLHYEYKYTCKLHGEALRIYTELRNNAT